MDLAELERSRKEEIMRTVLKYLSEVDYNKCNKVTDLLGVKTMSIVC